MGAEPEKISIVIPVFNEGVHIEKFLGDLFRSFAEKERPEVIVVDDGSTDDTPERLEKYGMETIRHERRSGYGASLKSGIRRATGEYICIIDADNTYSADDILPISSEVAGYDMVVGDRQDDDERPKDHLLAKKSVEKILSNISGVRVEDLNSGLRIMRKDILVKYLDSLPNGFSFTSSLTLIMLLKKYRIKYIPIRYERREKGTKVRRVMFVAAFVSGYLKILCRYFTGRL